MTTKKLSYRTLIITIIILIIIGTGLFVYIKNTTPTGDRELWKEIQKEYEDLINPTSGIEKVLAQHEAELMAIEGVTGVGIGKCDGLHCVIVYVRNESFLESEEIPKELEGYKIELRVGGIYKAL